ncbi:helix-turn-helix transcriptional regulator [Kineobactrum salinum]|uniref:helix-turn-helix transcriptional regulator n=1 Tax=Kineobactrum salinum TaxID=2708301 RepID=UPI0018D7DB66|nr:AraC family transcriptional regulator [Kineobactrum salinum]
MSYALQDYTFDPARGAEELLDAFVPMTDRHHYRLDVKGPCGSGRYEFCGLADGFFVTFGDGNLNRPQSGYLSCPDMLQIYVASRGDGEYLFSGGDQLSLEAPSTVIVIEPAGEPATEVTLSGCARYVCVAVHREALEALFCGSEYELPVVLQEFLEGKLDYTVARALPLSTALLRCLDDLHTCSLEGRRRRLFVHSKTVEIVCHILQALEHADGFGSPEATILTARGVLKAQRLLMTNFATPPSLESLAHEVGLSRSGLCTGFRQILGQSVFDYIQQLRMEQALAMLNKRDASISQIAYAVGYARPSSFSVAVQRHFGASPTALRRRILSTK